MSQPPAPSPSSADLVSQVKLFFTGEPQALRVLIACVTAVGATAIDPPFLSLTSAEVQAFLRDTTIHAPLIVALEFLALAVITLVGGTAGDLSGRRRILLAGLAGLVAANGLSLFVVGGPFLRPANMLHVASAAMVMPMAIAIVTLAFAPAMRPFAFGMLFGFRSVATLLGSVFMSLAEQAGVLWLAYVPVILVSLAALWLVGRSVPESSARQAVRGTSAMVNLALLVSTFLIAFFILSGVSLLRNWLLVLIALGVLVLAFVTARWWMRRLSHFLDWDVFTGRDVALAIIAGMMMSGVQGAFLFEFWTFNNDIQGTGWFVASLRTVPYVLGVLAGSIMVAAITRRWGTRRTMAVGMGVMAIGLLFMALIRRDTSSWQMLIPVFAIGYGFGISSPVRAQVILSTPPSNLVGASAAVNTATGQLGYALGITTSSAIIIRLADTTFLRTLEQAGVSQTVIDEVSQSLPEFAARAAEADYAALPPSLDEFAAFGYASAWTASMAQMFLRFGIAMLVGAAAVYLAMSRREQGRPGESETAPAQSALGTPGAP